MESVDLDLDQIIAARVEALMREQGISQTELARRATEAGHRLHGEQVSMALGGRRPARSKAEAFAAGLGVSIADLVGEDSDDTDPVPESPPAEGARKG
jgi:transcriptional regulator with XRE-family HTH domain